MLLLFHAVQYKTTINADEQAIADIDRAIRELEAKIDKQRHNIGG